MAGTDAFVGTSDDDDYTPPQTEVGCPPAGTNENKECWLPDLGGPLVDIVDESEMELLSRAVEVFTSALDPRSSEIGDKNNSAIQPRTAWAVQAICFVLQENTYDP